MAQSEVRNFQHRKGMNPLDYIIIKDGAGDIIDISNWNFTLNVRQSHRPDSTLLETFSNGNTKLSITGPSGRIDFDLDGTEFATTIIKGVRIDYVYDMEGIDSVSGINYPALKGNWTVISNL